VNFRRECAWMRAAWGVQNSGGRAERQAGLRLSMQTTVQGGDSHNFVIKRQHTYRLVKGLSRGRLLAPFSEIFDVDCSGLPDVTPLERRSVRVAREACHNRSELCFYENRVQIVLALVCAKLLSHVVNPR
jgi:hypothetical protein